jgi:hypothetical protein
MGVLMGVLAMAGCATTGYQRANKAGTSIAALRQELVFGRQQVTRTLNALNSLVASEMGDLVPKFKAFGREVAQLNKSGNAASRRAATMRSKTAAYFEQWGKEIETIGNPQVRAESAKRRSETMRSYQQIEGPARDAAAAYNPLLRDLRDIQSHLKQDLTARGIAGVRGFVSTATQDAAVLQQKIDAVVGELDRIASELNTQAATGR